MKLFSKHPNLRLLLLALIATGLIAFALYLKAAQSKASFYDVFLPKKKTVSTQNTDEKKPEQTSQPTPPPPPAKTPEGKSLGDTTAQAADSSSLTSVITRAKATQYGISAITNKIVSGNCIFTFSDGSTQSSSLTTSKDYSVCTANGTNLAGKSVTVKITAGSESATSNSMVVEE